MGYIYDLTSLAVTVEDYNHNPTKKKIVIV